MYPLTELTDVPARWNGAMRWKRHFRLAHMARLYATLDWETASGSLAVGRWLHGLVVIERAGFGATRVNLREDPRGPATGEYVADWREGGRLTLADGRHWSWCPQGAGLGRWAFRDSADRMAIELTIDSMALMPAGGATVSPWAARLVELPMLVALGWYLAVQTIDDGALLVGIAAKR